MTEKRVLAWHGDGDLKERTILRMKMHAEQDKFIQGTYMALGGELGTVTNQWGGCLHGCLTAENLVAERQVSIEEFIRTHEDGVNWHIETQRIFGIDARVGSGLDHVYEENTNLPLAEVAIQLLEAIPVGADLSDVNFYDDAYYLLPLPEVLEILRNAPVPNLGEGQ